MRNLLGSVGGVLDDALRAVGQVRLIPIEEHEIRPSRRGGWRGCRRGGDRGGRHVERVTYAEDEVVAELRVQLDGRGGAGPRAAVELLADGIKAVQSKKGPLLLREGPGKGEATFYGWPDPAIPFGALTEEQVKLIRRFTENVTLLFDGDEAGIRAAIRGIDLLLAGGLNVRLVLLPDGHDPDSYSRSTGATALQEYLTANARDFITFIAALYAKDSAGDPIRKAESVREIVKSISKVPDGIKRSVYTSETATLLGVPEQVLLTELNKILISERRNRDRSGPDATPEEQALVIAPEQQRNPKYEH